MGTRLKSASLRQRPQDAAAILDVEKILHRMLQIRFDMINTHPSMNPYQVDRTQAEHEARAKIFWGDPPDKVFTFLLGHAVPPEEAQMLVDSMVAERISALRGLGAGKILKGAGIMIVSAIGVFALARSPIFSAKILGAIVAIGLWGAWKAFKGCFLFFAPQMESGDVADL